MDGAGKCISSFRDKFGGTFTMACPQGKLQGGKGALSTGDRRAVWRFGGDFAILFLPFVCLRTCRRQRYGPEGGESGGVLYTSIKSHAQTLLPTYLHTYLPTYL